MVDVRLGQFGLPDDGRHRVDRAYLTDLAQREVGRNGIVANLGPLGTITAMSLFPYCISTPVFLQVLLLPLLGAIAD